MKNAAVLMPSPAGCHVTAKQAKLGSMTSSHVKGELH